MRELIFLLHREPLVNGLNRDPNGGGYVGGLIVGSLIALTSVVWVIINKRSEECNIFIGTLEARRRFSLFWSYGGVAIGSVVAIICVAHL